MSLNSIISRMRGKAETFATTGEQPVRPNYLGSGQGRQLIETGSLTGGAIAVPPGPFYQITLGNPARGEPSSEDESSDTSWVVSLAIRL